MPGSAPPDKNRWSIRTTVEVAIFCGVMGGFLEGILRTWLQSNWLTSFESRLTAVSAQLIWIAPVSYVPLFGLIGLFGALATRIARFPADRIMTVVAGALAFHAPLSSSGRLATVSTVLLSLGLAMTCERLLHRAGMRGLRWIRIGLPAAAVLVLVAGIGVEWSRHDAERKAEAALPPAAAGAPNLVFIVVDTLRADHLSNYGYARDTTPAIAALAKEGVQFDSAIAASSWTLPSHVSMLTGHYPSSHGAELEHYDNRFPTIGAALMERGYRTRVITANTGVFSTAHGFGPGFIRFNDSFYSVADGFFRTQLGHDIQKRLLKPFGWSRPARRLAEDVTEAAKEWIARDGTHPFFLFLNYFDLHDPYTSADPWRGKFSSTPSPGGRFDSTGGIELPELRPEEVREEIDAYDGAAAYVDHWIGRLVEYLERSGLAKNTVVVVTADHGESLGQHGFMGHGTTLYFEQLRVPLIVRLPGRVPGGIRIQTPVSLTAVPATLLALAGGRGTIQFPGESLTAFWTQSPGQASVSPIFSELRKRPFRSPSGEIDAMRSVIEGTWHFIDHSLSEPELFDLLRDPQELQNLSGQPGLETRIQHFRELIRTHLPQSQ